jgi:hypothetical protein
MRTLVDMPMKIAGQTIVMHIDLVITGSTSLSPFLRSVRPARAAGVSILAAR